MIYLSASFLPIASSRLFRVFGDGRDSAALLRTLPSDLYCVFIQCSAITLTDGVAFSTLKRSSFSWA